VFGYAQGRGGLSVRTREPSCWAVAYEVLAVKPLAIDKRRIANGTFTVELPRPPSVNSAFVTDFKTRRRFASKEYTAWKKEASQMLLAQRPRCSVGQVEITITVQEITRYPSDIDNRVKPILDCLVENGIIDGDTAKTVRSITARWDSEIVGAIVEVKPAPEWVVRKACP
jgi:Holliday junction resolvase RusA-like endonuclease